MPIVWELTVSTQRLNLFWPEHQYFNCPATFQRGPFAQRIALLSELAGAEELIDAELHQSFLSMPQKETSEKQTVV